MAPLPVSVPLGIIVSSCRSIQVPALDMPAPHPCQFHRHVRCLAVRGGSSDASPTDTTADSILHSFEEDLVDIRLQMVAEAEDEWDKWRVEMLERRRRRELARRQSRAAADISAYSRTYASIVQSQEVNDDEDVQKSVELDTTSDDVASSDLPSDGLTESEDDDNGENHDDTIASESVSDGSESSMATDDEANGQVSANEEEEDGEDESEHFEEEYGDPSSDDVQQDDTGIDLVGDYDAPTDTNDDLVEDIDHGNLQQTSTSVEIKEARKKKSVRKQKKKKKKKKKKKRRKRNGKKRRGSKSVGADESECSDDETILFSSVVDMESNEEEEDEEDESEHFEEEDGDPSSDDVQQDDTGIDLVGDYDAPSDTDDDLIGGTVDIATTTSVSKKPTSSFRSRARKVLFYTGFVLFLSLLKEVLDAIVSWALM